MKSPLSQQLTELALQTGHKKSVTGKAEGYSRLQPETTFSKWEMSQVEQDNAYQDALKYSGE